VGRQPAPWRYAWRCSADCNSAAHAEGGPYTPT
jgi:hypothetical protein